MNSSKTVFKRPWDGHALSARLKIYIEKKCTELSYGYGKPKGGGVNTKKIWLANKELAELLNIKEGDKIGDEKWFYWTFNKYIKLQYYYDKIDQFLDSYFLELHMLGRHPRPSIHFLH